MHPQPSNSDRAAGAGHCSPAGSSGRGRRRSRREDLAAVALAALFFVLAFSSNTQKSLTWDEPSFISAGYVYLTRGDFRFNASHPPLLQDLMALPLVFQDLFVPPGDFSYWERRGNPVVAFGRRFVFHSGSASARARISTGWRGTSPSVVPAGRSTFFDSSDRAAATGVAGHVCAKPLRSRRPAMPGLEGHLRTVGTRNVRTGWSVATCAIFVPP